MTRCPPKEKPRLIMMNVGMISQSGKRWKSRIFKMFLMGLRWYLTMSLYGQWQEKSGCHERPSILFTNFGSSLEKGLDIKNNPKLPWAESAATARLFSRKRKPRREKGSTETILEPSANQGIISIAANSLPVQMIYIYYLTQLGLQGYTV